MSRKHAYYVPAVMVFNAPLPHEFPREARWDRPVSTGAACHTEIERAVLTGLYEVIERDALMIHWENRLAGLLRGVPVELSSVVRRIERQRFIVHLVELPSDLGARVALAAIVDETGRRAALGIGAAARATWPAAAYRAVEEAFLSVLWVSTRRQLGSPVLCDLWLALAGVPEPVVHADLYGFRETVRRCAFLWRGPRRLVDSAPPDDDSPKWPSPAEELAWLRSRVEARGFDVIVADITPTEGVELGLRVVRVLVPGLVPLSRGLHLRPLRNGRLRLVPAFFGRASDHLPAGNPDPHPLP